MNIGEIAEKFIRAAEIERASREHVGPHPLRAQQLPYVHDFADKAGWRKEFGDKLMQGEDPLSDERKAFWERVGIMPSAHELSEMEAMHDWIVAVGNEKERRALLAWARSKVGGKSFRRWCFNVEGIHPETGRRRKNRALELIAAQVIRMPGQNSQKARSGVLPVDAEIEHNSGTVGDDAGKRDSLNSWLADGAFSSFLTDGKDDFSWAAKRNEQRRRQRKSKAKTTA